MREVYVAGVGMTKFGRSEFKSQLELFGEAAMDAINESNLKPKDIQARFVGNANGDINEGITVMGSHAAAEIGLNHVPAIKMEGACASGTIAIINAFMWVAAGVVDIAMAAGCERNTVYPTPDAMRLMNTGAHHRYEGPTGVTFPGMFAMMANQYSHKYGIPMDQLKEYMCMVSMKNHKNGVNNPRSQFRKEITREQYYSSAMIASPLQMFDCCPMSDGAAAMVICSKDVINKLTNQPVQIAGVGQASSGGLGTQMDYTRPIAREISVQKAYKMAGMTPNDINVVELHDCFTIAEIVATEQLGFFDFGKGVIGLEKGETQVTGRIPINPSGGLKAKGHPVGATGVAQGFEVCNQIRGKCGPRQLENIKTGLTDTLGGPLSAIGNIIYKRGW
jgi:acetyl-CoA C-acetyltransferase/acetyl-CoA acyltransferase